MFWGLQSAIATNHLFLSKPVHFLAGEDGVELKITLNTTMKEHVRKHDIVRTHQQVHNTMSLLIQHTPELIHL